MSPDGPSTSPRRLRDWLTARLRERLLPLVAEKAARVGRPVKRITVRRHALALGQLRARRLAVPFQSGWHWLRPMSSITWWHTKWRTSPARTTARCFWPSRATSFDGPIEKPQAWLKKHGEALLQYGA